MEQLIAQHPKVFAEPEGLPPVRSCDHKITLQPNAAPPNIRQYRIPHKHRDEVDKQVHQLLKSKVIRPSQGPYASPVIIVPKKDATWRLCTDSRDLNSITIKDKFPIPVIEDLLDERSEERRVGKECRN